MRPNPHLLYISFPLELAYLVKGFPDMNVSVQLGLELLQKRDIETGNRNITQSRTRSDENDF